VLTRAYSEAYNLLKSELAAEEYGEIVTNGFDGMFSHGGLANTVLARRSAWCGTIKSFLATLSQVQQAYSQFRHHKARRWLNTLADRVVYYGNILDVLVQHHPEYVSLAWGTFKILFVVRWHSHWTQFFSNSLSCIFSSAFGR